METPEYKFLMKSVGSILTDTNRTTLHKMYTYKTKQNKTKQNKTKQTYLDLM